MDLINYKKKIIPLMIACALFNVGILLLLHYLEYLGMGKALLATLMFNVIGNATFLYLNAATLGLRFKSLLQSNPNTLILYLLIFITLHIPICGIYVLYKTFQNIGPNTIDLKKIVLSRFAPFIVITTLLIVIIPFAKNEKYFPTRISYILTPSSENYTFDFALESKKIFNFKDNIKKLCPNELTRADCVLSLARERHNAFALSVSEIILYIAVDAMELFNFKTRVAKDKNSGVIAAKMLIKHNLEMLTMSCSRARPIIKFGIPVSHLFLGNLELALLEIVDEVVHIKLFNVAVPALWKIAKSGKEKTDMSESFNKITEFKKTSCYRATEF